MYINKLALLTILPACSSWRGHSNTRRLPCHRCGPRSWPGTSRCTIMPALAESSTECRSGEDEFLQTPQNALQDTTSGCSATNNRIAYLKRRTHIMRIILFESGTHPDQLSITAGSGQANCSKLETRACFSLGRNPSTHTYPSFTFCWSTSVMARFSRRVSLTHDASIVPSPWVSSSAFCTYEDDIGAGDFGFASFLRIGYSLTNIHCYAKVHLAR